MAKKNNDEKIGKVRLDENGKIVGPGPGRPKGVPNKVTLDFKQAVVNLLEFAAPQMVDWLGQVSREDPSKALDLINKLADYAFPKLGRTEHTGPNGGPVAVSNVTAQVLREIPTERLESILAASDDAGKN